MLSVTGGDTDIGAGFPNEDAPPGEPSMKNFTAIAGDGGNGTGAGHRGGDGGTLLIFQLGGGETDGGFREGHDGVNNPP
ncbi:hypothetical protein MSP7336_01232 [Mycobacterium shimoidei]|uniref:Uncharacterized protein n=2 Tax=Mycobacterium shimoidei TaxID=29313 RepID=A0A375YVP0_MYCSH|nr:hypothetical protein MSP7336_01232 [Mycobacterium shimoidei]